MRSITLGAVAAAALVLLVLSFGQAAPPGGAMVAHRWTHEFPDTDGFGGKQSSLAFDSRGNAYISYWHASMRGFRVAYRDGGTWYVDDIEVTNG